MDVTLEQIKSVDLEDVGCPLGCARNDDLVLVGRDLLHSLPGDFQVVRCVTCGLMRTNPRPTTATIGFYYPEDYGPYIGTQVARAPRQRKRFWRLRSSVKRLFQFNTTRIPRLQPGRMLEIGCASGAFLHDMAARGWQVEGIEFSPVAAATASRLGYTVHVARVEDAPVTAASFDLIVGWMVLEHLHAPLLALRRLRELLAPDGYLVVSLPNASSLASRIFGSSWYALHLPNHLYHYDQRSIRLVLETAGWKVERIFFHRTLVDFVASLGDVLRRRGIRRLGEQLFEFPRYPGIWLYLLYPLASVFAALGQTSRMTVWARRAP